MPVKKKTRIAAWLSPAEVRTFKKVKKYVVSYCGRVSDAEVLRFLIRSWGDTEWQ
jgi:hypothetical protein